MVEKYLKNLSEHARLLRTSEFGNPGARGLAGLTYSTAAPGVPQLKFLDSLYEFCI